MVHKKPYGHDQQEDSTATPENVADDSSFSGDEDCEINAPSPKKRRGAQKKVVTVPIGHREESRSKGEVYPPPDSWSWRKYGQKPIKGSPYPRGYYRCSSSKGCPARKQVERSCLNPTILLITYSCEHNHRNPTASKHPSTISATNAPPTTTSTTNASIPTSTDNVPIKFAPTDDFRAFAKHPELDSDNSTGGFNELAGELGWFFDVGSTMMDSSALVGPTWVDADIVVIEVQKVLKVAVKL